MATATALLSTSWLLACGTLPRTYSFESSRSFNVSYDQVWERLTGFFASHNIQILEAEKDTGHIRADTPGFDDTDADCGSPPFPWVADARVMQLNVFVSRFEGGVTATVTTTFHEWRHNSPLFKEVTCNSKGTVESAVLGALQ